MIHQQFEVNEERERYVERVDEQLLTKKVRGRRRENMRGRPGKQRLQRIRDAIKKRNIGSEGNSGTCKKGDF